MVRDINEESKEIRNGNRFVKEEHGSGVFPRDVDRLFVKYSNLRHKVYNTHKNSFPDEATRRELMSYINEQFVKLTKEYDINGYVDFPGYIKKALNLRVRYSFVKGRFRDKGREFLGTEDDEVEGMLSEDVHSTEAIEERELLEYLMSGTNFNEMELYILQALIGGRAKEKGLAKSIANTFGTSISEAKRELTEIQNYIWYKLHS